VFLPIADAPCASCYAGALSKGHYIIGCRLLSTRFGNLYSLRTAAAASNGSCLPDKIRKFQHQHAAGVVSIQVDTCPYEHVSAAANRHTRTNVSSMQQRSKYRYVTHRTTPNYRQPHLHFNFSKRNIS